MALLLAKTSVGLNRRKFKFERSGEDEVVVGTSTMDTNDWKIAYKISFLFLSMFNLRIAFYPLALLNQYYNIKVIDMVQFIIDEISNSNEDYNVMKEVSDHLDKQIDLILNSVASVSPTRLSDGVSFTPHEASTFIMACELDKTYLELDVIFKKYVLNLIVLKQNHS